MVLSSGLRTHPQEHPREFGVQFISHGGCMLVRAGAQDRDHTGQGLRDVDVCLDGFSS